MTVRHQKTLCGNGFTYHRGLETLIEIPDPLLDAVRRAAAAAPGGGH